MHSVAEIEVAPIGAGVSTRDAVREALAILGKTNLVTRTHALSTEVEGELDEVLAAVSAIHDTLHDSGIPRLSTTMKLHTRTDKRPSLDNAVDAVS